MLHRMPTVLLVCALMMGTHTAVEQSSNNSPVQRPVLASRTAMAHHVLVNSSRNHVSGSHSNEDPWRKLLCVKAGDNVPTDHSI